MKKKTVALAHPLPVPSGGAVVAHGVRGDDTRMWVEGPTGLIRETTLDHAIRFTFFAKNPDVVGRSRVPLGATICADPGLSSPSVLGKRRPSEFLRADDDEETKDSEPPRAGPASGDRASTTAGETTGWTMTPSQLEAIMAEARRAAVEAQAVVTGNLVMRSSGGKTSFNPPQARIDVHRAITNASHAGKCPSSFLEDVQTSSRLKFRRDPGVVTRLYDFLFARRGLSIMHFAPMTIEEQLREVESQEHSSEDYSVAVKAPTPSVPKEWSDLQDAVAGLIQYAAVYCDNATMRLTLTLVGFVSSLQCGGTWPKQHLQTLVWWVNSQLLAYRELVHADVSNQTDTRGAALDWFSPTTPGLEQLRSMLVIRAMNELTSARERQHGGDDGRGTPGNQRPAGKQAVERKTPRDVVAAVPRGAEGRELCLKFASRLGCRSRVPGKCNFGDRAHFVPPALPDVVRRHIVTKFGGVSDAHN